MTKHVFFRACMSDTVTTAVVDKQNTDIYTAHALSSARCDEASHPTNQEFESTNSSDTCDSRLLRNSALHLRRFGSHIPRLLLAQSTEGTFITCRLRTARQTEARRRTKTRWRRTDHVQEDLVWCRRRGGL